MFVGARPWQLLHTYPAPEPEWEKAPFEVYFRTEEEPRRLGIKALIPSDQSTQPTFANRWITLGEPNVLSEGDISWFELSPEAQRLASAIALDMVAADLPQMYRDSGYIPGLNDIDTINNYIQQIERDPTGKSIPEDLTDEISEIAAAYETSNVGQPLAMFGEVLKASVIDIQLNVRPARLRIVLYCMVILSQWLDYPWAGYADDYYGSGGPSFSISYQIILSPITLTELIENAEEWMGLWWAEVMNALAMRNAPSAQIQ